MRKHILLVFLMLSLSLIAQQKVAIYVTSSSNVDSSIREIVGSELVSGFVTNKNYQAIERTADFLKELAKEQEYQRSGNVDDQQISALGRQFGVDLVCVANITPFKDSYYINARLINAENATVQATARETSALASLEDFVQATEHLASKLMGNAIAVQTAASELPKEYSQIQSGTRYMQPIEIDNTGKYTKVLFKFATANPDKIKASVSSYAQDLKTGIKYKFIGATGIYASEWTSVEPGIHSFTLTCEKMPDNIENLLLYQDEDWNWKVLLVPYGKKNYYLFEDKMEEVYKQVVEEKRRQIATNEANEKQKQQQQEELNNSMAALGQAIANAVNPQYILKITNNHLHTRLVYVDSKLIGEVGGLSVKFFAVPSNLYQTITLVQKNYVFHQSKEYFNIKVRPQKGQVVEIVNNP